MTFVCTYTGNSKTTGHIRMFYIIEWLLYYRKCLFFMLELNIRYNWQIMAPNTHRRFFFSKPFVSLHAQLENYRLYMDGQHIEWLLYYQTFLVWFTVARETQLESYCPWHALVVLWYNIVRIYCKPVHTSLFSAQLGLRTICSYSPALCYSEFLEVFPHYVHKVQHYT